MNKLQSVQVKNQLKREPNRGLEKASKKTGNANHTFSRRKEGLGQGPREKRGGRVCGKRAAQSSGLLCKQGDNRQ